MARVRKAANLSLDEGLLSEARGLNINISRAAERGIAQAIRDERERAWRSENAKAIEEMNRYVEKYGLPLSKWRQF
ncbi:type II toxin-antitoxin system CcdA family antitoxin [Rhizobium sp. 2YAF20]|uniref:type II toxin-antitoxin system CcdA family antitoxin n=1 Tax=Rhizobium sp. 2YAF20 TaxID=3233027 RepID=UPI003F9B3327